MTQPTSSTSSDLQTMLPLKKRVSSRGGNIASAASSTFKDVATLIQAGFSDQIAAYVKANIRLLDRKQLQLLMQYVRRNVDPHLLRIWSTAWRNLSEKSSDTARIGEDNLENTQLQPLIRRASNHGEYITILDKGEFKEMGTTSHPLLASSPEQISAFITASKKLHPKQIQCLKEYVQRNVDPDLLRIWLAVRRISSVRFAEEVKVTVVSNHIGEIEKFITPLRDDSAGQTVMLQVPDFKYLIDNCVRDIELYLAVAKNKLIELAVLEKQNILRDTAVKCAAFICTVLNELISAQAITPSNFPDELMSTVKSMNVYVESIDKKTFTALVKGKGLPVDLYNAPEYRKLRTALDNNTWGDDEEKNITFTYITPDTMEIFENVIKIFSLDSQVITATLQVQPIQKRISRRSSKRN